MFSVNPFFLKILIYRQNFHSKRPLILLGFAYKIFYVHFYNWNISSELDTTKAILHSERDFIFYDVKSHNSD